MKSKARLPRIRLRAYLAGRVEALLGYLVTDGDGVIWAIPEISKNHPAATRAVAYRLDMAKIDKTPVPGRMDQIISYRDVIYGPELIENRGAMGSGKPSKNVANRRTQDIIDPLSVAMDRVSQDAVLNGIILVVDDDLEGGRIAAAFLREAGYHVFSVSNGNEALARLSVGPKFDALVTDYAMPGLNGADLVEQARELQANLPALVITGYPGAEGLTTISSYVAVLRKPFRRGDFVQRVARLIEDCRANLGHVGQSADESPSFGVSGPDRNFTSWRPQSDSGRE